MMKFSENYILSEMEEIWDNSKVKTSYSKHYWVLGDFFCETIFSLM